MFYLHRPVKALICTKNKKHPSCSRQKVHASAGEMTFLDSKDRVCFLLKLSIVPGAAAVVLRGEPPTAGQQPIRGQEGETLRPRRPSLATFPPHKKEGNSGKQHPCGQTTLSLGRQKPAVTVMALLPSTGGAELLILKQKSNIWPQHKNPASVI